MLWTISMACSFTADTIDDLIVNWDGLPPEMKRGPLFMVPGWLKAWWQTFGGGADLLLGKIKQGGQIIGIVPLRLNNNEARFIGDAAVCDYLDFIVSPGKENDFYSALLYELDSRGVSRLILEALRPDSTVMTALIAVARKMGYPMLCRKGAVSVALDLPPSWPQYLDGLSVKQRHEVRRKLRRLNEEGKVSFRAVKGTQYTKAEFDIFIRQFRQSRPDKAHFMDTRMSSFFKRLTQAMAAAGFLRFGFLELEEAPLASVLFFDYNNSRYLYNSGYNPGYGRLSVGLLAKVLCIEDAIEHGVQGFDFLRGGEAYKYQLGGHEIPLYECRLDIAGKND